MSECKRWVSAGYCVHQQDQSSVELHIIASCCATALSKRERYTAAETEASDCTCYITTTQQATQAAAK